MLLDWGYRICDDSQDGINRDKIIENVYQNTDESITRDDAKFVFEWQRCSCADGGVALGRARAGYGSRR